MGLYLLQRAGMGDSPQATKAAAYLLHHMPGALAEPQQWEYHGICWGSAAMALRGGDDARKYAAWIYRHLAARQSADGSFREMTTMIALVSVALALAPDMTHNR